MKIRFLNVHARYPMRAGILAEYYIFNAIYRVRVYSDLLSQRQLVHPSGKVAYGIS